MRPLRVDVVFHDLEHHALELAALDHEGLRRAVDDDLDVLFLGVLELPLGGLEELARLARHDLHALRAEAQRVRQQSIAVLPTPMISTFSPICLDVPEGHGLEPGDADVDVGGAFLAARQASVPCPSARRSRRRSAS
jgi:hypothetical protein